MPLLRPRTPRERAIAAQSTAGGIVGTLVGTAAHAVLAGPLGWWPGLLLAPAAGLPAGILAGLFHRPSGTDLRPDADAAPPPQAAQGLPPVAGGGGGSPPWPRDLG